jgi:hypothetical protein
LCRLPPSGALEKIQKAGTFNGEYKDRAFKAQRTSNWGMISQTAIKEAVVRG